MIHGRLFVTGKDFSKVEEMLKQVIGPSKFSFMSVDGVNTISFYQEQGHHGTEVLWKLTTYLAGLDCALCPPKNHFVTSSITIDSVTYHYTEKGWEEVKEWIVGVINSDDLVQPIELHYYGATKEGIKYILCDLAKADMEGHVVDFFHYPDSIEFVEEKPNGILYSRLHFLDTETTIEYAARPFEEFKKNLKELLNK